MQLSASIGLNIQYKMFCHLKLANFICQYGLSPNPDGRAQSSMKIEVEFTTTSHNCYIIRNLQLDRKRVFPSPLLRTEHIQLSPACSRNSVRPSSWYDNWIFCVLLQNCNTMQPNYRLLQWLAIYYDLEARYFLTFTVIGC